SPVKSRRSRSVSKNMAEAKLLADLDLRLFTGESGVPDYANCARDAFDVEDLLDQDELELQAELRNTIARRHALAKEGAELLTYVVNATRELEADHRLTQATQQLGITRKAAAQQSARLRSAAAENAELHSAARAAGIAVGETSAKQPPPVPPPSLQLVSSS